ncbi:MAG: aminotransferase class I/II-fold pyridoxal phosphate-dependent enzyme [Ruminococcaceae bacterium]|nr:aminotransferase class I/II-fold pyridoxal phosphate-dependent enzyme [Oscillospiraceae bacterium]
MKYDFTSVIDRRGCDALAVEALGQPGFPAAPKAGFDAIPMWVADMNFPTAPAIVDALQKRAAHPLYGYFQAPDRYYESIIRWQKARNGVTGLAKEHIGHENGVLGGLMSAVSALCPAGGRVLLHSPTYIGFTSTLQNGGYEIVHSPLQRDEAGVWRMDFADMEAHFQSGIRVLIFCSPHNPTGRVWERWEIEAVAELCEKYDVTVISDEIWSDIILTGRHIPTQSVPALRERTVALYAPSKTFNLAGLVGSYHVVYNDELRAALRRQGSLSHYNNGNVLSMHALMAGYSCHGADWVNALCETIRTNVDFACDFIEKNFPGVSVARPQGTYMLFIDCTAWCADHGVTLDELIRRGWDVGVAWQDGRPFHGNCHIRMNLALPLSRVQEAFDRLEKYVFI